MPERREISWNWLDGVALPIATALMYAAWFYPLLGVFLRDPAIGVRAPGAAFALCLGIMAVGLVMGRLARRWVGLVAVPAGSLVFGLLALVWLRSVVRGPARWWPDSIHALYTDTPLMITSVVMVTGAAFLWWQGMRIARTRYAGLGQSFAIGAIALTGSLFIAALLPLPGMLLRERETARGPIDVARMFLDSIAPLSLMMFPLSVFMALILGALRHVVGELAADMAEWTIPLGLLFLGLVSQANVPVHTLAAPMLLFIGAGLIALSLLRVSRTQRAQELRLGVRLSVDRHWFLTTLGLVALIVVLGWGADRLLSPLLFRLRWLTNGLSWPSSDWWRVPWRVRPRSPGIASGAWDAEFPKGFERFMDVVLLLGAIIALSLLFARRGWLVRFLRTLGQRPQATVLRYVRERRESVFTWDLFTSQLRALMDRMRIEPRPPPFVDPGTRGDTRRVIRELYQRFLARASALDLPRRRGQTPIAYMRALSRVFPEAQGALETLTRAYVAVRYGALSPPPELVRATRAALAHIGRAFDALECAERTIDELVALH